MTDLRSPSWSTPKESTPYALTEGTLCLGRVFEGGFRAGLSTDIMAVGGVICGALSSECAFEKSKHRLVSKRPESRDNGRLNKGRLIDSEIIIPAIITVNESWRV